MEQEGNNDAAKNDEITATPSKPFLENRIKVALAGIVSLVFVFCVFYLMGVASFFPVTLIFLFLLYLLQTKKLKRNTKILVSAVLILTGLGYSFKPWLVRSCGFIPQEVCHTILCIGDENPSSAFGMTSCNGIRIEIPF